MRINIGNFTGYYDKNRTETEGKTSLVHANEHAFLVDKFFSDAEGPKRTTACLKIWSFYHETVLKNMVEVRCDLKLAKKLKLSEKTKQFLPNKVKYNLGRKKSGPSETWSRSRPLPIMFHTSFAPKFNLIVAIFVLFSFLSYKSGKLVSSNLFYSRYYAFTFILW